MSFLPPAPDFPKNEEEIVETWTTNQTFKTQDALALERSDPPYTFYDGPPFATGLPHYGHILAGTIKDVVTRFACMNGYRVERRAGWDCHGLPVEYEIDQMLKITHRDQVLEMGIDKYNETCRSIVTRYTSEWERTINRLGRWIDFENDYKTMDATFMESVWWVFGRLYEKDLVYRGYKVMPFSTACGTPLSNFEAGLNYKDVRDPAVVVSFPIVGGGDDDDDGTTSFVAWTTTPWTLPSNLALCVHPTMEYVKIRDVKAGGTGQKYILAKSRIVQMYPEINSKKFKKGGGKPSDLYEILDTYVGTDLVGRRYEPPFDYFADEPDGSSSNYFQVLSDTYVTDDSGTGIVHQAPAFGEDDHRVCLAAGVVVKGADMPCPVDGNGMFTSKCPDVAGKHVKDADDTLVQLVKDKGRLVQKDVLEHSYPFCWRSDTPLIYKAVPSWFVRVEEIRDKIVANNNKTHWVPSSVKEGRFHNWLVDARDWAVSRNRFWGTPIPIWATDDFSEMVCISSIDQLEELSGVRVTDLHRESIDDITIPSKKTPGAVLRRIDEVFDCWFESGSMPYAQKHYPFENKEEFEKTFPADFIAEGIDQTRGWFYTLMVLSTALFDKPAFQNLIANGLVLAGDGKKMSKRLKNYPDPTLVIGRYGADALRMYLINSPVVRAESLKFQESGVLGVVKEVFLPWYNAFRFFLQNVERWEESTGQKFVPSPDKVRATTNPTDVWISAATQQLIKYVHDEMGAYRLYTVMPALVDYVTQLTNWYVRLNRERLKGFDSGETCGSEEAETGLQVLYDILLDVTIVMAPFTPFITEYLYQHLRKMQPSYQETLKDPNAGKSNPVIPGKSDSVHFLRLPAYDEGRLNAAAVESMEALQLIVELGRNVREKRNIGLKTPIKSVVVVLRDPSETVVNGINGPLRNYILSELNAWDFRVVPREEEHEWVKLSLLPNLAVLGKKLGKKMGPVKKYITEMSHADAVSCMASGKIVVPGQDVTIDTESEVLSKLAFSKDGENWEATQSPAGDAVVAVDCTQDEAILSAGRAREVVNHVQQLRKASGLDLSDAVEVFFDEGADGVTVTERAVSQNVDALKTKLRGVVPLPVRCAADGRVVLGCESVEVGGSRVEVSISRPALSPRDGLDNEVLSFLSTLDPANVCTNGGGSASSGAVLNCTIDGKTFVLKEGQDFWLNAVAKATVTKSVDWL